MASGQSLVPTILLLLLCIVSTAVANSIIQVVSGDRKIQIDDNLYCDSWRLSIETNNYGVWSTVPERCESFVQDYMTGYRYQSDLEFVASVSLTFAKTVELAGDGKDVWVFDIDETLLSNLPYYATIGFGTETYNETSWDEWVASGEAPALVPSLKLYEELQQLGFTIVLLTGRDEYQRNVTVKNLLAAGYTDWETLFLRATSDEGKKAIVYKSEKRAELISEGYRIHGNSGDQWSDLLGYAVANRSFKIPDPLYYIS
ncbi:acid phosphatase 1-like [Corylus avellana]|uniref:acid phosphatase 1-like n=1 Tax=Corylus avellana TaxID=13451 RepID=UPI001E20B447|nr:acid phosphatase 1-like [Corylus avellana]